MSDKHTTQIGYFDYIQQLGEKTSKPIEMKKHYSQLGNDCDNADIVFYFGQTGFLIDKIILIERRIEPITQQCCMFPKKNDTNCITVIEM